MRCVCGSTRDGVGRVELLVGCVVRCNDAAAVRMHEPKNVTGWQETCRLNTKLIRVFFTINDSNRMVGR